MARFRSRIKVPDEINTPEQAEIITAIGASYYIESPVGYGKYYVTNLANLKDDDKKLQAYIKIASQVRDLKKDYNNKNGFPEGYVDIFRGYFDTSTLTKEEIALFNQAAEIVIANYSEAREKAQAERVALARERRRERDRERTRKAKEAKQAGTETQATTQTTAPADKNIKTLEEFRKVVNNTRARKRDFKRL